MRLPDLIAREDLIHRLARARLAGSLPQSLLLHGAPGVGKQRLALWIGQLLLCERPGPQGPCNDCKACRLARALEHPDLHWYFPVARPKGSKTGEALRAALEEARVAGLAERRENPIRASVPSTEPVGLYLAIAQALRARAHKKPAMGDHQVFLIARAEALVSQEASQEAANALLKLLEEPHHGTTLILTTSAPGRVLATIRSRTLPLFVPPLPRGRVRDFLVEVAGAPADQAERATRLARGSIGRALGFLPDDDEVGPLEETRRNAFTLLRAALARGSAEGFGVAMGYPPARARGLLGLLAFVQEALRDLAAVAAGARQAVVNADTLDFLDRVVKEHGIQPLAAARALDLVEEARALAAGNVNPQLIVAGLLMDLRDALVGRRPAPAGEAQ